MSTLEEVDAHWSQYPNDNIACNPEANNFCEVDFDAGSCSPGELGLPETYTVRTPSGGRHLRYLGSLPTTQHKLSPHVDTVGLKGGIVLPPSIVNGKEYEVIDDRDPVALPTGIGEKIAATDSRHKSTAIQLDLPINRDRARDFISHSVRGGRVAVSGHAGNRTTYQMANDVFDFGLSYETVHALMAEHWNPHCQPPWPDGDLRFYIQNAFNYRQNDVGCEAVEGVETFDAVKETKGPPKEKYRGLKILTLTDIRNKPDPEPLVRGLFIRGENICISGPPKRGKSTVMLDIALSLAANVPVFGKLDVLRHGPVIYLSGEGHSGMKARTQAWLQEHKLSEGVVPFYYVEGVPLTRNAKEEIDKFVHGVREFLIDMKHLPEPVLVVIDTMSRSMTGLEEDAENVSVYMKLTDTIRNSLECTFVTLAHTAKDGAKGIRGSGVSIADTDALWSVEMNEQKLIKFESTLLRNSADLGPYCFKLKSVKVDAIKTELNTGAVLENIPIDTWKSKDDGSSLVYDADLVIRPNLVTLNAFGEQRAVKTLILAETICRMMAGESAEDWSLRVDRCRKILNKLSKAGLQGFVFKKDNETHWMLQTK